MWLFTIYGFFSVACAKDLSADKRGKYTFGLPNDPNTLMIRARDPQHLGNLKKRFTELDGIEIEMTEGRDYCCRLIVKKADWANIVYALATEQTWSNFKNEVFKNKQHVESGYEHALHDVWHTMFSLQSRVANAARALKRRWFPDETSSPTGRLLFPRDNYPAMQNIPVPVSREQKRANRAAIKRLRKDHRESVRSMIE